MTEALTVPTDPKPTAPPARTRPSRPRQPYRHSRPVFDLTLRIQSEYARRLLRDREFRPAMHALYGIEVILHLVGEDDDAEQVETLIRERLEGLADELQREIARLQVLLADRGLDKTRPRYTHPVTATVHVASPTIALYAALIQEFDRLLMGLDTLWLSGLLPSKERLAVAIRWRNRIGGAGQEFIGLHRRAYAAAERRGQRATVDEAEREVVSVPEEEGSEALPPADDPAVSEPTD
ncbi:AcaB family transcriptional regulator [Thiorhodococcus mannitoliphagus]|uniref:AcaB family transcriptional regulator n=1 Tax=Thiorhodococcus mannitoliphagus TaxID=329406 RepID=UPI001F10157D|nr:AcaB family transcriptional regulator [Thiorhodococcus mannitoliphagus]